MSGVMLTGDWGKALWPGVEAWYGDSYAQYPEEYKMLFDIHKSNKAFEEDVGISSFGLAAIRAEGAPVQYGKGRQGFVTRYSHVEYAKGFMISKILMEDDQYGVVGKRRAESLAFSMRQTKEIVAANVYNRATTAGFVGGDGVTLLNTAHPNVAGGTWANKPSVDVDLSEAALEQACIDISKFTDDAGLKIAVMPQSLIIPADLFFIANRILKSDLRPGTANNDVNVLNATGKFPKGIMVNHYLTDTNAWFIRTNAPHGMKYFERRADSFDPVENDYDTDNAKFKATMRFAAGWTDPRGIYGSTGS